MKYPRRLRFDEGGVRELGTTREMDLVRVEEGPHRATEEVKKVRDESTMEKFF